MPASKKTAATIASTIILSGALATATATPAQAAPYNGACGPGYTLTGLQNITGGTVFLARNASTDHHCVVTIRNFPGSALPMRAFLRISGQVDIEDSGLRTNYAGPVKGYTPGGTCFTWGGAIDTATWESFVTCN